MTDIGHYGVLHPSLVFGIIHFEKLKIIICSIVAEVLDAIHRDHKLIGNWKGRRECHIESDWLLIYMVESDQVVFERTRTHSDLFQR